MEDQLAHARVEEPDARPAEVHDAMSRLMERLDVLVESVTILENKLVAVLSPPQPSAVLEAAPRVFQSPLAQTIETQADRVDAIDRHVTDIRNRAEI